MYIKEEHSFPMVAGLTPVLNLATVESLLLGAPFSGISLKTLLANQSMRSID